MSESQPEHIQKLDWRINNLTWTTAPFTIPGTQRIMPAGVEVKQAALIQYGHERLGITIPNATALFLGLSQMYRVEAELWLRKCLEAKDRKSGQLPDSEAFTFYERMIASVVFACTSLEAFVNEEIPDAYVYVVTEKRSTQQYNKEQIERHLNLDTKLGAVLPSVLGVPSPKGGTLWNSYDKLRNLRDRVIHMKTKDRNFYGTDGGSIWNALLSNQLPDTYKTAKRMMEHFLNAKSETPRWFQKCPF